MEVKGQKVDGRIVKKTIKLWLWSLLRFGRWYMPHIPEIKPEELLKKLESNETPLLIDIRDKSELKKFGYIEHAQMFPYFKFPSYLDRISKDYDQEIVTICPGGGASLVIAEVLISEGYTNVKSLKGGVKRWYKKKFPLLQLDEAKEKEFQALDSEEQEQLKQLEETSSDADIVIALSLDVRNFSCPKPVLESKKAIKKINIGEVLEIVATDPGSKRDIPAWAVNTKQEMLSFREVNNEYHYLIKRAT